MSTTHTVIKKKLATAAEELRANRKWKATELWSEVLRMANSDNEVDAMYNLDLQDRVADLFLSIGDDVKANELNDEIEEGLKDIKGEDEWEEICAHVEQRRLTSARRRIDNPVTTAPSPRRASTLPVPRSTPALRPQIDEDTDCERPIALRNKAKSFPAVYHKPDGSSEESDPGIGKSINSDLQPVAEILPRNTVISEKDLLR